MKAWIELATLIGWEDLDVADVDSHYGYWEKGDLTGRRNGNHYWELIASVRGSQLDEPAE
jgi:hypothetical protein